MIKLGEKGVALPYSFAWDILNCEIQLELSEYLSLNLFQKMSQLCQLGIDYYLTICSNKFQYFKRRLQYVKAKQVQMSVVEPEVINTPQRKKEKIQKQICLSIEQLSKNKEISEWLQQSDKKLKDYQLQVSGLLEKQKIQLNLRIRARNRKAFRSFACPTTAGDEEEAQPVTGHSFCENNINVDSNKYLYEQSEGV